MLQNQLRVKGEVWELKNWKWAAWRAGKYTHGVQKYCVAKPSAIRRSVPHKEKPSLVRVWSRVALEPSSAHPSGAHDLATCFSEGQKVSLVCAILLRAPRNRLVVRTHTPFLSSALPMTSPTSYPGALPIHSLITWQWDTDLCAGTAVNKVGEVPGLMNIPSKKEQQPQEIQILVVSSQWPEAVRLSDQVVWCGVAGLGGYFRRSLWGHGLWVESQRVRRSQPRGILDHWEPFLSLSEKRRLDERESCGSGVLGWHEEILLEFLFSRLTY